MVHLANIDLNLLVVFDLLYQEQNTQRGLRCALALHSQR